MEKEIITTCKYIKSEFDNIPNISKIQFFNDGGAKTKILNINKSNIDYLISLLHQLKENNYK
jgi:hypothetical protein